MATAPALKRMTFGEGGSALVFTALALLCIVIAAKAYTPGYAFHAFLFSAASAGAVFTIFNRYFERENLDAAQRVLAAAGYRVHAAVPPDGGAWGRTTVSSPASPTTTWGR